MTYMLNSIDEAIDGKFLVEKKLNHQVDSGTMIHIMDAQKVSNGSFTVDYRVTETGQDFDIVFQSLKDFCSWAKPDTFIARNYDCFSKDEIRHYIKVNNRTFNSFCVPWIAVCLVIVWIVALFVIKGGLGIVLGIVLSLVSIVAVISIFKKQKTNLKLKMYKKTASKWGVNF